MGHGERSGGGARTHRPPWAFRGGRTAGTTSTPAASRTPCRRATRGTRASTSGRRTSATGGTVCPCSWTRSVASPPSRGVVTHETRLLRRPRLGLRDRAPRERPARDGSGPSGPITTRSQSRADKGVTKRSFGRNRGMGALTPTRSSGSSPRT